MRDDSTNDHPPASRRPRDGKPGPARKKFAPLAGAARPTEPARPPHESEPGAPQRIAKVIARAGACSRRDAEVRIGEGRVALNGAVLTNPATNVTAADEIVIDGVPLAARSKTRLFLFHKPRGLVTTERDPEGRQTIFDYLRAHWPDAPRLVSVGRLDINTEGLLLLTNDGGLARTLELPSTGWVRRYRVRAKGETDQAALDRLRQGVTVDGVAYAEIEATLDRAQGANCWLTMGLREGKNREIKRVLEHLGLEVNRLIRLSFGPFQLGDIPEGALEEVKTRVLRDQLGAALAEAAGVDFAGPAEDAIRAPAARPEPPRVRREDPAARENPRENPRGRPDREACELRPRALSSREPSPRKPSPRESSPPQREARKKPAPSAHKHISALRAEMAEPGGARKRTLRSETADRSGRAVPVERLVAARPAKGQETRQEGRREAPDAVPASRNARRFESERKTREGAPERPMRGPGRGASPAPRVRAPEPRWPESKAAPRGAPTGERREAANEKSRRTPQRWPHQSAEAARSLRSRQGSVAARCAPGRRRGAEALRQAIARAEGGRRAGRNGRGAEALRRTSGEGGTEIRPARVSRQESRSRPGRPRVRCAPAWPRARLSRQR